jgi:hypothetical protein
MTVDETLRRIIEDNRESRRDIQRRLARLSDVIQYGTVEEYREAMKEIFSDDDDQPEEADDTRED